MSNGADGGRVPDRRIAAWIGAAVRIEGKVASAEDLTIDGEIEGSIEIGGNCLTIGEDARIKGDVLARTVTISGKVTGNVKAVEKIDLQAAGAVQGNITAPRFVMADGATVLGKVHAG